MHFMFEFDNKKLNIYIYIYIGKKFYEFDFYF